MQSWGWGRRQSEPLRKEEVAEVARAPEAQGRPAQPQTHICFESGASGLLAGLRSVSQSEICPPNECVQALTLSTSEHDRLGASTFEGTAKVQQGHRGKPSFIVTSVLGRKGIFAQREAL